MSQTPTSPDPPQGSPAPLHPRTQSLIVLAVAGAAVALLLLALLVRVHGAQAAQAAAPPADGRTLRLGPAQLASLTIEPVRTLAFRSEQLADGRIALDADHATQVFSPYSGRVTRLLAPLGARVQRGAPLFEIEASEYAQAQADLSAAAAAAKLARLNEARRHASYDAQGASLQDWQQSQADLATAEGALQLVRNRLRILGAGASEIARLEAGEAGGTAGAIATVRAPIEGVVTDRQIGPGQYLQAGGSTPAYTIGGLDSVWLVADVREADATALEPGQAVQVQVPALPERVLAARLASVGALVDPVTHRVAVRATLRNADGKLRPGMFASVRVATSAASPAPGVPLGAVIREGDQSRVWVLGAGDVLALRRIRTGREQGGMLEVLDGVRAGERIVTRGSLFIDRAAQPG